jgi:multiple sugar transport system substrate-binding protein
MMRKINSTAVLLCAILIIVAACAGCGNKTAETPAKASNEAPAKEAAQVQAKTVSNEPVTLKVWLSVAMTDEEFGLYFTNPVKNKHPNITLEKIRPAKGSFLPDVIQAGQTPDIIYNSQNLNPLLDLDLPMDLRDQIKKNNFQNKRIVAELVDDRYQGPNGEIFGLPINQNEPLLWYNKSLFNKFGVPFPKDGMTWEDSVDLTRRLTRNEGGVQYYGFYPYHGAVTEMGNVLSLPFVDPKTDQAVISPKWNDVFTTAMNIFNVPGNKPEKLIGGGMARNEFMADQTLAMIVHQYNAMFSFFNILKKNNVDFDFVAPPRYANLKDTKTANSFNQLVVTKTTKHPDQAFQVISVALSDEVQTAAAKNGKIPALVSSAVQKQFGADNALLKSKHVQALYFPGKLPVKQDPNPYDKFVKNEIKDAFVKVYDGTDINTALREAKENADKNIAAEKAK